MRVRKLIVAKVRQIVLVIGYGVRLVLLLLMIYCYLGLLSCVLYMVTMFAAMSNSRNSTAIEENSDGLRMT
jgi:hypothetical protein